MKNNYKMKWILILVVIMFSSCTNIQQYNENNYSNILEELESNNISYQNKSFIDVFNEVMNKSYLNISKNNNLSIAIEKIKKYELNESEIQKMIDINLSIQNYNQTIFDLVESSDSLFDMYYDKCSDENNFEGLKYCRNISNQIYKSRTNLQQTIFDWYNYEKEYYKLNNKKLYLDNKDLFDSVEQEILLFQDKIYSRVEYMALECLIIEENSLQEKQCDNIMYEFEQMYYYYEDLEYKYSMSFENNNTVHIEFILPFELEKQISIENIDTNINQEEIVIDNYYNRLYEIDEELNEVDKEMQEVDNEISKAIETYNNCLKKPNLQSFSGEKRDISTKCSSEKSNVNELENKYFELSRDYDKLIREYNLYR